MGGKVALLQRIKSVFTARSASPEPSATSIPVLTAAKDPFATQDRIGLMLRLEKRLMFDGAGFGVGLDFFTDPDPVTTYDANLI